MQSTARREMSCRLTVGTSMFRKKQSKRQDESDYLIIEGQSKEKLREGRTPEEYRLSDAPGYISPICITGGNMNQAS